EREAGDGGPGPAPHPDPVPSGQVGVAPPPAVHRHTPRPPQAGGPLHVKIANRGARNGPGDGRPDHEHRDKALVPGVTSPRAGALLLAPAIMLLLVFFAYPLTTIVWRSFTDPFTGRTPVC